LFFVTNPFPQFEQILTQSNASLIAFEEATELTIGMRGNGNGWNTGWIEQCYGVEGVERLRGQRVLCSGTTAGRADAMHTYLGAMLKQLRLPCASARGADQGMHNFVLRAATPPIVDLVVSPQGDGPVNTLSALYRLRGSLDSLGLLDEQGFVLNEDQTRSAVIHQWDRDPGVSRWVRSRTKVV
jgi:hypothetical protein